MRLTVGVISLVFLLHLVRAKGSTKQKLAEIMANQETIVEDVAGLGLKLQGLDDAMQMLQNQISGLKAGYTGCTNSCPKGWFLHKESCYLFSEETVTWSQSLLRCHNEGGYLVEINDEAENDFLKRYGTYLQANVWIGATDYMAEGLWQWARNETVISKTAFHDWEAREPNGAGREHCLMSYKAFGGQWVDAGCNMRAIYMCEKEMGCDPMSKMTRK